MPNKSLESKIAIVTGASRGLGRATATRLVAEGAMVVVGYRNNDEAAQSLVTELGPERAFAVPGDLGSVAGVDEFYARVDAGLRERTGQAAFDILVASAGVISNSTVTETDEAAFDRLFDINMKGVFFTIQRALGRIRDGGRIITFSSGLARMTLPGYGAYAATKAGIEALTRYLAAELGPRKITVNAIAPGAILTDMNPWLKTEEGAKQLSAHTALGRVGLPSDIADAIAFLASNDARWVTAQRIEASGGQML